MDYRITDAASGESFLCKEEESLFAGMHRTGKGPIRYGCEGGGCGVCKVKIESGTYERFKNMSRRHVTEEEEAQGYVLACCVKPRSEITLRKA